MRAATSVQHNQNTETLRILVVIPARYNSSRLPGKPLAMIGGRSMIQRVYEQVLKCKGVDHVLVATDDDRIASAVTLFGGQVAITSSAHQSGTSRCAEVAAKLHGKYDVLINVQGDEPFIAPEQVERIIRCFDDSSVTIATLIKQITMPSDLTNPNVVKAVVGTSNQALYFSRSALPHLRGIPEPDWYTTGIFFKHIGIYGYRTDILQQLVQLPENNLEQAESLEQLRWLANGFRIYAAITSEETMSIDTQEDLDKGIRYAAENPER